MSKPHPPHQNKKSRMVGLLILATLLIGGGATVQLTLAGRVAPNTFAFNEDLSGQSAESAQESMSRALEAFEQEPVQVFFDGMDTSYLFSYDQLGVDFQKTESIEAIPVVNLKNALWLIPGQLVEENHVETVFFIDGEQLKTTLETTVVDLNRTVKEPQMSWDETLWDFEVTPEESGWEANIEEFQKVLEDQIASFENAPIELTVTPIEPVMTAEELEAQKETVSEALSRGMNLVTDSDYWPIDWTEHLDLLTFEPIQWVEFDGKKLVIDPEKMGGKTYNDLSFQKGLEIELNKEGFTTYIQENLAGEIEVEPQNVVISMDEEGAISFEGSAVDGVKIEYDSLGTLVELALNNQLEEVKIPLLETPGEVTAPQELVDKGITELVSTGYTNFYGSPKNRIHNITVGIARYDGVLIGPGETFSFGERLGRVDASTGYLPELVIKEEGTIPEYGGGICQVSSTLYRAVLFAGFPVVERHPHSYAVSCYAYPVGWGLDATVYPPSVDLKFTNDSEHYILIQSYVDGSDAYFKFYGTKDGRTVSMDGPYVGNHIGAPAAVYTVTNSLAAGVIEKKDSAHNGFTATWYRTINYANGESVTETIPSVYRAWGAKYLVGAGTEGFESESEE